MTAADNAPAENDPDAAAFAVELNPFGVVGLLRQVPGYIYGVGSIFWCACVTLTSLAIRPFTSTEPMMQYWSKVWTALFWWCFGVKVETDGLENIERMKPYVIAVNHKSWADAASLLFAFKYHQDFVFVVKRSLFLIPIFGQYIWMMGYPGVRRSKKGRGANRGVIDKAVEALHAGRSVFVFPEGTRTPDHRFLPFRKGAASIAKAADVPILPVVVSGSAAVFPKGAMFVRPGRIRLEVMAPIEPGARSVLELIDHVQSTIMRRYRLGVDGAPLEDQPDLLARAMYPGSRGGRSSRSDTDEAPAGADRDASHVTPGPSDA